MTVREVFLDIAGLIGIIWLLFCGFEIIAGKIREYRKKENPGEQLTPETTKEPSEPEKSYSQSNASSPLPHVSGEKSAEIRREREDANRSSLMEVLKEMGCQPEQEEDGNVVVSFQGERFLILFNGAFLRIWDLNWMNTKNSDDDFTLLKDAINYSNFSFGPSILMHVPDDDGNIYISSCMDLMYDYEKSDNKEYIVSMLETFFVIKHNLHREYMRLKENPDACTLNPYPLGFDTATLSDPDSPQAN